MFVQPTAPKMQESILAYDEQFVPFFFSHSFCYYKYNEQNNIMQVSKLWNRALPITAHCTLRSFIFMTMDDMAASIDCPEKKKIFLSFKGLPEYPECLNLGSIHLQMLESLKGTHLLYFNMSTDLTDAETKKINEIKGVFCDSNKYFDRVLDLGDFKLFNETELTLAEEEKNDFYFLNSSFLTDTEKFLWFTSLISPLFNEYVKNEKKIQRLSELATQRKPLENYFEWMALKFIDKKETYIPVAMESLFKMYPHKFDQIKFASQTKYLSDKFFENGQFDVYPELFQCLKEVRYRPTFNPLCVKVMQKLLDIDKKEEALHLLKLLALNAREKYTETYFSDFLVHCCSKNWYDFTVSLVAGSGIKMVPFILNAAIKAKNFNFARKFYMAHEGYCNANLVSYKDKIQQAENAEQDRLQQELERAQAQQEENELINESVFADAAA